MKRTQNIWFIFFLVSLSNIANSQGFHNIIAQSNDHPGYVTDEYGGGLSFVDFDLDGLDDLTFATHRGERIKFLKNTGGEFVELEIPDITDTSEVKQALWIDFDNDGDLDLYLSSDKRNRLYERKDQLDFIDISDNAGLPPTELTTYSSTWLDYDRDGYLDLCMSYRTEDHTGWIELYRNNGNRTFSEKTNAAKLANIGSSVLAMTSCDYNNDGWDDIFLGQDFEQGNRLLKNMGNGQFDDVSEESGVLFYMNSMTASFGDYDNDGWDDLYVTNTTEGNIFLHNNQDGTFTNVAEKYKLGIKNVTFGTIFIDADNDMDLDLHIGGMLSNFTLENNGYDAPFIKRNNDWGLSSDNAFNNGVAMGDIDNDGFTDFAKNSVTRPNFINSKNSIWRNDFSGNHYIKIGLIGTISNSNGIGARILVFAGGIAQTQRIACGESFSSQHSLQKLFGLGSHTVIDSIIVRWPSGNVSKQYDVPADQTLKIEEPLGGCMDAVACNYNADASYDNGSCRYPSEYYDCLGCINDEDNDGICDELEVLGCMDRSACNYSSEATEEDGSCYYLPKQSIEGEYRPVALELYTYKYTGASLSTYEWQVENGSIINGRNTNKVHILWNQEGMGNVRVRETSEDGCVGEEASLEVEIETVTIKKEEKWSIYPNPVYGQLIIKGSAEGVALIYDANGKLVLSQYTNSENRTLDTSYLSPGLYHIKILSDVEHFSSKFVKL